MEDLPLRLSREERRLAGRLGGALWLLALPTVAIALTLPVVPGQHEGPALAIAAAATIWGATAAFAVPWERAGALPYHALAAISIVAIAGLVATTGGAASPLWPLFFLTVAYCSYFYPLRQAVPYVGACMLAQVLPLAYDGGSLSAGGGALVIAACCYPGVGGVVMLGKLQLVRLRDTAEHLSRHDPLIDLPNRRALLARLERELGSKEPVELGLFLVDLDNFKDANSLYGHQAGDRALRAAARALSAAVRAEDLVARLGGDEFAVLARGLDRARLASMADRLIASLARESEALDLAGFRLAASVGWARHPEDAGEGEDLIAAADLSLAAAKALGKGTSQSPLDWLPDAHTV